MLSTINAEILISVLFWIAQSTIIFFCNVKTGKTEEIIIKIVMKKM